jgi:predicted Zn finger-like uncharacterized protein
MRIACPSCSVAYDVPDSLLKAGRVVRCAGCGGEWTPVEAMAAEPEPAPPEPPASAPEPPPAAAAPPVPTIADRAPPATEPAPRPASAMDRLVQPPARSSSLVQLRLAWLASVLLLALLAWGAHAWRAQIVTAWPPSARLYAAFGMQPVPAPPR